MTDGVSKAFIVDMVPAEKRGMAIGLYYTVMGILPILSSVIAGVMWELMGASAPFLFGSATAFIAAILMIIAIPKRSL